jgi:hypothetical protein
MIGSAILSDLHSAELQLFRTAISFFAKPSESRDLAYAAYAAHPTYMYLQHAHYNSHVVVTL